MALYMLLSQPATHSLNVLPYFFAKLGPKARKEQQSGSHFSWKPAGVMVATRVGKYLEIILRSSTQILGCSVKVMPMIRNRSSE